MNGGPDGGNFLYFLVQILCDPTNGKNQMVELDFGLLYVVGVLVLSRGQWIMDTQQKHEAEKRWNPPVKLQLLDIKTGSIQAIQDISHPSHSSAQKAVCSVAGYAAGSGFSSEPLDQPSLQQKAPKPPPALLINGPCPASAFSENSCWPVDGAPPGHAGLHRIRGRQKKHHVKV